MNTALQYNTLEESRVVINTLPRNAQKASGPPSDLYSFELIVSDIKDGYFELSVLPLLTIKHKNNACYFKTIDRYSIKESEIRNYNLAYHLILLAIDNFNYLLSIQQTDISGKKYENPDYEDCLADIEENYFFSVPQLL
ncbi:MAG TPA: hypothetical protein VK559_00720 [Ferruginibacter sp.]|nr:hypothetical protein [Ferruginibacter sp.]